jgi:hypothetical protein
MKARMFASVALLLFLAIAQGCASLKPPANRSPYEEEINR